MKRILAIAMCLALTAAAAQVSAQNRGGNNRQSSERGNPPSERQQRTPEEMAKMRADRMKEQLELTDAQHAQVLELFKEQMENRSANMSMSREEREKLTEEQRAERREEMQKMRDEQDAKLKEILTAEQFAKYEENRRNMPQNGLNGRVAGSGDNRPEGVQRGGQRSGNRNR